MPRTWLGGWWMVVGVVGLLFRGGTTWAQPAFVPVARVEPAPDREMMLYSGAAPGSEHWDWDQRTVAVESKDASGAVRRGQPMVQNVVRPKLLHYPAAKGRSVGTAMIVAPGGGFMSLMMTYEGVDVARRLNAEGVDAFVLEYRLRRMGVPGEPGPVLPPGVFESIPEVLIRGSTNGLQANQNLAELAIEDGRRAVVVVREKAGELGYRADRIGMIGFSAGGTVTLGAVTGPAESRPNFAAVIYPARLDGREPPEGAPPLFVAHAANDQVVSDAGSLKLYESWRRAGIPVELHLFQSGRHGFLQKGGGAERYLDRVVDWMAGNRWLERAAAKETSSGTNGVSAVPKTVP